jgi:hypothetical protein
LAVRSDFQAAGSVAGAPDSWAIAEPAQRVKRRAGNRPRRIPDIDDRDSGWRQGEG